MAIKSQLKRLEKRLGVWLCPHCNLALPPREEEYGYQDVFTDEERLEIMGRLFTRFYNRETVLLLLAGLAPALRRDIADVYPIQPDEQLGDEVAA
jgi:hypothetical protein